MEITGNIKLIGEMVTGTSKKTGKEWQKRQLVITTTEQYPQDIAIDFMGDKVSEINNYEAGNPVSVSINIKGNEYNGKYYNSINGWKIANYIGNINNADQQPAREQVIEDSPF